MIIKNGTNSNIEQHKQKLGLTGDVYLVNGHLLESLESHRRLFPDSTATTIEQAESERITFEQEQERIRLEQAAQAEQERITAQATEEDLQDNKEAANGGER